MSLTKPIDLKQLITVVVTIGVSLRNMKHLKMLLCQMYLQTATLMILFPTYITYLGKIIRLHGIKVIPNTVQRYHIAYCWKKLDFPVRLKIFYAKFLGPSFFWWSEINENKVIGVGVELILSYICLEMLQQCRSLWCRLWNFGVL